MSIAELINIIATRTGKPKHYKISCSAFVEVLAACQISLEVQKLEWVRPGS